MQALNQFAGMSLHNMYALKQRIHVWELVHSVRHSYMGICIIVLQFLDVSDVKLSPTIYKYAELSTNIELSLMQAVRHSNANFPTPKALVKTKQYQQCRRFCFFLCVS